MRSSNLLPDRVRNSARAAEPGAERPRTARLNGAIARKRGVPVPRWAMALGIALSAGAAGCADQPTGIRDTPRPSTAISTTGDAEREAVARLARWVAVALNDQNVRAQVQQHLRSSRSTLEHKLDLRPYLRGTGGSLLKRVAGAGGVSEQQILATLDALPALEFYMPVRAHRNRWTGTEEVLVAASLEENTVIAFDPQGRAVPVSAATPPDRPTLVLVPNETDFSREVPATVRNVAAAGGALGTWDVRSLGGSTASAAFATGGDAVAMSNGCDPTTAIVPCDEPIGGGGGGYPPLVPMPSAPGLYMRQMVIYDKAEPWARGAPEIEVHLVGTQPDQYYAYSTGFGGPANTLGYRAYPVRMGFSCGGEEAAVPAAKRFDFNGEGGATYTESVLIAEPPNFAKRETVVASPYQNVLKDRLVQVGPPFRIEVWERDDGSACPSPAESMLAEYFQVNLRVNFNPDGSYRGLGASGSVDDWKRAFGITNANDYMGAWQLDTWEQFEALADNTFFNSGWVTVRFTNQGVTRYTVPPGQDPYTGP